MIRFIILIFFAVFSIHSFSQVTILTENFEHAGALPTGWTNQAVSGTVNWTSTTGGYTANPPNAHGGTYNALFYSGNYSVNKTKLVTSVINLGSYTYCTLDFYHAQVNWAGDCDTLKVYYKTSAGGAWNLIQTFSGQVVDWKHRQLTLPNPSATYYIAFEGISDYGYGVCIDDMTVSAYPNILLNSTTNNTVVNTCGALLFDSGGPSGQYLNNESYTITFTSASGGCVRAVLQNYNIEKDFDFLYFYDGPNTTSPQIGERVHASPGEIVSTIDKTGNAYIALSGSLTIKFTSDNATIDDGFKLKIDCPENCVAPTTSGTVPAADNCGTSTPICDFNGYSGSTDSTIYTTDHDEIDAYNLGIFCGGINNNSWLSFIAESTEAVLDVWVTDCKGSFYGTVKGIQLEVFDTDCNTFVPKSNCWSPSEQMNGQITATGLVPGRKYILMIDGYAKDNCKYVFAASQGLLVADAGKDQTICEGDYVELIASGGTSVSWSSSPADPSLSGQTNDFTIYVTPSQTTTYTATVTGSNPSCPGTADVTVYVDAANASYTGLAAGYCTNSSNATLTPSPTGGTFTGPGITGSTFNPSTAGVGNHSITYTYDYSVVTVFSEDFDPTTGAGWTSGAISGTNSWATGKPKGGNGQNTNVNSNKDPLIDHTSNTSNNVYGQGLSATVGNGLGGYNNTSNEWLKTPAINCSAVKNTTLSFWRYANFEPTYDESYVEISSDNTNWTTLNEPFYPTDNHWVLRIINISTHADGKATVYIRWRSNSDESQTYSGWNIDDVKITGVQTGGSCTSTKVNTTLVSPPSVAGTASSNTTICNGATATITLAGNTGTIQWQQSANGSTGWANVTGGSGATSASYTTPAITSTTYYRAVVTSGACASANSNTVTITVDPLSVAGTAASSASICSGSTSTINLSGYTGTIQWQQSANGTSGWANVTGGTGSNTASYTTASLTATTYFRAVVSNGACAATNSNVITITVVPPSVAGTASTPAAICSGNTSSITLSGYTGTIQWQQSANGTSGWANVTGGTGATTANYTTASLTTTTWYRALVTNSICTSSASNVVSVIVSPQSVGGTATSVSPICTGSTSTLSLIGYTGNIQWQQSANGTTGWANVTGGSGATTASYTSPILTSTTYYRAVVTSGTCASINSNTVTVTVSPNSVGGTISGTSPVCYNSSTTLTLTGQTGNIQWQTSPNGTTWTDISGASSNSYTTPNLTTITYYRAIVTSGACPYATSASYAINITPSSVGGTVNAIPATICPGGNSSLSLTGNTGNIQWYSSPDGTSNWTIIAGATSATYNTPNLSSTTYYRATVTSGTCTPANSSVASVTVNPASIGGNALATPNAVCNGGTSVITLSGYSGAIQWYSSPNGLSGWTIIPGATSASYSTPVLTTTIYYQAQVTNGSGCPSSNSTVASVTVGNVSVGGAASANPNMVCSGSSSSLTLTGYAGSIQWYSSTTGTSGWTLIPGATSASYTTPALSTGMYYRATVSSGPGCATDNSSIVSVGIYPVSVGGSVSGTSPICYGGNTTVSLTGYTGNIQWQSSPDGTTWTNISGATSTTYNTPGLSTTTSYRAIVTSGTCPQSSSGIFTVVVNPASIGGAASANPNSVCNGGTSTISLTGNTGSVQWFTSPDGINWTIINGATSTSYNTPLLTSTTYYRATVTSGTGCSSANSSIASVSVGNASVGGTSSANPLSICSGGSSTISLTGYTGSIQWYSSPNGTSGWTIIPGATSSIYNATNLTATTYFRAVVSTGPGCTTDNSSIIPVTVIPPSEGGTATASQTTVCYNGNTSLSLTGYTGSIQWQQSSNGSSWVNIPGATSPTYNASNLTSSTYFQASVSNQGCAPDNSNSLLINVNPDINAGTISASQSICSGSIPATFSQITQPTGGTGIYSYQWQSSLNGTSWTDITSATNPTYTSGALNATTYFRLVVTSSPCGSKYSNTITITVNPNPTVNAGPDQSVFYNTSANLAGSANGGTSPYSFSWQPAASITNPTVQNPTTTNLTSTTLFTLTATDANNCSASDQVIVTINGGPLSVILQASDSTVCSGSAIILQALPTGGNASGYTFTWSASSLTSPSITHNPVNNTTYSVTVADGTGNTASDNVTVITYANPIAEAGSNQVICAGGSVSISASASQGTFPYSYTWSGLGSGQTHNVSPNSTATFYITVTDINACTSSDFMVVTVNPKPSIQTLSAGNSYCAGGSGVPVSLSNSETGVNYQLFINGIASGSPLAGTGSAITWSNQTSAGPYTVVATNSSNCTQTMNPGSGVSVTINPLPVPDINGLISVCSGQTISYLTNSLPTNNFQWTITGGSPVSATSSAVDITWGTAGNGKVIVAETNASTNCVGKDSITVVIHANPVALAEISAGSNDTICFGSATTITGQGSTGTSAISYSWSNGINSSTQTISPVSNAAYTLTVTDIYGCKSSQTLNIIVNPLPNVFAGNDTSICSGSQATISAIAISGTAPFSFAWNNSIGSGALHSVFPLTTTTYIVTLTDKNNCVDKDTMRVTVNNSPIANAGNDTSICKGVAATISASQSSGSQLTFSWNNNLGAGITHNINPNSTTQYIVTITDFNGCTDSDTVKVTVNNLPNADAGDDRAICKGSSTILSGLGSSGTIPLSYEWSNTTSTNATQVVVPVSTTIYILTVTDANNCKKTDSVTVNINPKPTANAGNDTAVCKNSTVTLNAANSAGTLPLSYFWGNGLGIGTNHNITISGSIRYYLTVTDANSCFDTASVFIKSEELPEFSILTTKSCTNSSNGSADVVIISAKTPINYSWSTNSTDTMLTSISAGNYSVSVTDKIGCKTVKTFEIGAKSGANISVITHNTSCRGNKDGKAEVAVTNAIPPVTYQWSTSGTGTILTNIGAGTYEISVTDSTGCVTAKSFEILDTDNFSCLEIPSAFTPNKDGKNDRWIIKHIDMYPNASVEIYNRWGLLIYSADKLSDIDKCWDGTYNGTDVTSGSYVYILRLNDTLEPIQGVLTIIR